MTNDRRYVGQINPDNTRTLWRIDDTGGTQVPTFAWATDGSIGWGSAHEPAMADPELDCALAILTDHHGDPALAFEQAARFANDVLAYTRPTSELLLPETELHTYGPAPSIEFNADAAPIRDLLTATIADTGDPLEVAATGLGLDPEWAQNVAAGAVDYLSIDEVKQVCGRLYVTPYDLWPASEATVIEGIWPATQWPSAQPIDLSAPISQTPEGFAPAPGTEPTATLALDGAA
jgi:hypothetical protein